MAKSLDKRFERYEQLLTNLLGSIDDWTAEELDQFLAEAGVDGDQLQRRLYNSVNEIAGSHRVANRNVPAHVADFLRQMRPVDLPTSDPEVAQSVARAWVQRLLGGRGPLLAEPQVAHAFRNRQGELAPEDRVLLERLEAKVQQRRKKDK